MDCRRDTAMIRVEKLYHRYPGAETDALRGIDLCVPEGSLFGLLGPNGAGKTTLLSLLTGVLRLQQRGTVEIGGQSLREHLARAQARFALVPQDLAFYPMLTGRENLAFFAGLRGLAGGELEERVKACLALGALGGVADRPARSYSGGLKRRLNLAIGLLNRPELLFLDEPTVGIDIQSRAFLLESIRELHRAGATIVYTSHYMEEVQQLCDEVAIIDQGRVLVQDRLARLLERSREHQVIVDPEVPLDDAQWAQLRALGARAIEGRVGVPWGGDPSELARLFAELGAAGVRVARLEYGRRDLDALFLELTDRELRD